MTVPLFVLSSVVLVVAGFLLLEVRDDSQLLGPAVIVVVAATGLFLGSWFISKAGWPPELPEA
jgi:hypothetical protein